MLDFFEQQDSAKRRSLWWLLLYLLGLALVSGLTGLLFLAALSTDFWRGGNAGSLLGASVASLAGMLLFCAFRYISLLQGGRKVAEALGARPVLPAPEDPLERRFANVVAEMAIAAGLPMPGLYLQEQEPGINAFAAGHTLNDAVICVTRGALNALNRDELQAVVGHEFSHILNGDMRLNLRLTAGLYGLVGLGQLGRQLWHGSGSRRGRAGRGTLLGLGLMLLGYVGQQWGRLMRAAVSRQREFLADAAAVQFARHPQALANALKKVGGHQYASLIFHTAGEEYSHLFFCQGLSSTFAGLFATHPPLAERIRRLDPAWDGRYLAPDPADPAPEPPSRAEVAQAWLKEAPVSAALAGALAIAQGSAPAPQAPAPRLLETDPDGWLAVLPADKVTAARDPWLARQLIFALLLDGDETVRRRQLANLTRAEEVTALATPLTRPGERLALLELCLPALRQQSPQQYKAFREDLLQLMMADGRLAVGEWLVYRLLTHQLDSHFGRRAAPVVRYHKPAQLTDELTVLLSALAQQLASPSAPAERLFGLACNQLGLYRQQLQPEPSVRELACALTQLQQASEPLRRRVLQTLSKLIALDRQVSEPELEWFRLLAICLDCPTPAPRLTTGRR
ncbi:M48 family metallopeptidase [Pseudaeromonas paramecii]|uniref:M48 family metallopeptidase n=1 Tax=Pseudaeromonas paramecii TaxID=2138166 RepID=A0ABP8QJI6_9GAMM